MQNRRKSVVMEGAREPVGAGEACLHRRVGGRRRKCPAVCLQGLRIKRRGQKTPAGLGSEVCWLWQLGPDSLPQVKGKSGCPADPLVSKLGVGRAERL